MRRGAIDGGIQLDGYSKARGQVDRLPLLRRRRWGGVRHVEADRRLGKVFMAVRELDIVPAHLSGGQRHEYFGGLREQDIGIANAHRCVVDVRFSPFDSDRGWYIVGPHFHANQFERSGVYPKRAGCADIGRGAIGLDLVAAPGLRHTKVEARQHTSRYFFVPVILHRGGLDQENVTGVRRKNAAADHPAARKRGHVSLLEPARARPGQQLLVPHRGNLQKHDVDGAESIRARPLD